MMCLLTDLLKQPFVHEMFQVHRASLISGFGLHALCATISRKMGRDLSVDDAVQRDWSLKREVAGAHDCCWDLQVKLPVVIGHTHPFLLFHFSG